MASDYTDPVAKLLAYGTCDLSRSNERWPDYLKLGFADEDIPELIRMSIDPNLNHADGESLEVWGPVHAWRTLGQLGAKEAVLPLVRLFDKLENDDWLSMELPKVFSLIGPAALPALEEFLSNNDVDAIKRISIPKCLEKIAIAHSACREECANILTRQLEKYEANALVLNAFLVSGLADLNVLTSIDLIRAAYAKECVDISVMGDVEDVEILMGIRESRSTPPPRYHNIPGLPQLELPDLDRDFGDTKASPAQRQAKVGRNDPCPCGSGKKFKKCCLH